MNHHPYTLLSAFPWFGTAIVDSPGICQLRETQANTVTPATQAILTRLEAFESAHDNPTDGDALRIRSILLLEPNEQIHGRLAALNTLKSDKMSNLASDLLDYRLLDIALLMERGYELPTGQSCRLPIPQPAKMHYKQVSNWPSLVSRGLQLLRDCEDHTVPLTTSGQTDPTATILRSLIWRREAVEGHKIMANFECSAAYLSLILKGYMGLPTSMPDFKALITKLCDQAPFPAEGLDTFFDGLKSVHSFKLPLQLSLAVSPVCLFLPSCLMSKDLNRFSLVQMWQGLGGLRPEALSRVEMILWRALFDAASGASPLPHRLRAAFCEIGMVELNLVVFPSSEWLHADPTFQGALQLHSPSKARTLEAPEQNKSRPSEVPVETPEPEQSTDVPPLGAAKSSNDTNSIRTPPSSTTRVSDLAYERPVTRSLTTKLLPSAKRPQKTPINPRTAGRRGGNGNGGISSSRRRDSDMDEDSDDEIPQRLPRKRSNSTNACDAEHIMKALKLEDGNRKKIYETIDLTSEALGPPAVNLTVENVGQDRVIRSTPCKIWSLDGNTVYTPRFHFLQEGEWFTSLFKSVQDLQHRDLPPFLSNPASSFFLSLNAFQVAQLPVPHMQRCLRENVIILASTLPAVPFNEKTLASFCMLDKPVRIRDFSLPPQGDRTTTGTLAQLLHSAEIGGKGLSALDFSMPGGISPLPSLASDAYAWDVTMDMPWCGRRWEMPRTDLRWAEVATRDTYRPLGVSCNGFATHIEVKSGSQLLIVAKPSAFNPHSMTSFTVLEHFRRPYAPPAKTFDYQAIHLQAGYTAVIPPLVPFVLLATDNSITSMCYFYAASTLRTACIGLLHSSMTLDAANNRAQKAAICLLRRFAHYLHFVYLNDDYLSQQQYYPHAPDVLTSPGVVDVLTLCNVFEVINALTYTLTDLERHQLVEARRLCRRIVAWMGSKLSFTSDRGEPLDVYHDLWMGYLAQEVRSLHIYQDTLDRNQASTSTDIRPRLAACLKDRADFRVKFDHSPSRMPDQFGYPDDSTFSVGLRLDPGSVPDNIRGETSEDISYLAA